MSGIIDSSGVPANLNPTSLTFGTSGVGRFNLNCAGGQPTLNSIPASGATPSPFDFDFAGATGAVLSADGFFTLTNSGYYEGSIGWEGSYSSLRFGVTSSYGSILCSRDQSSGDFTYADGAIVVSGLTYAVRVNSQLRVNDAVFASPGQGLSFVTGSGQLAGQLTLIAGTKTITNTVLTSTMLVMLTKLTTGGTAGTIITRTITPGTSFTVNSNNALDTSTFAYLIIDLIAP